MKKLSTIVAAVASLAASGMAQAALLEGIHGGVRVNRGDGYVAVRGATQLKPGDLVMVDAKGEARLIYAKGCAVSVQAGSVAIVAAEPPCTQWTAQWPGAAEGLESEGGLSTTGMVVGGMALGAGAAGAAVAATSGNHASPLFIPPLPVSP